MIEAPERATLAETLARDPAPADDEVTIAVKLSRRNLDRLADGGLPCERIALKRVAEDESEILVFEGVYLMAAVGRRDFRDALPVKR